MLAPNASLRAAAIGFGREMAHAAGAPTEFSSPHRAPASNARSPALHLWVMLLARLFESLPLVCPNCGADMRIISFITKAEPVERILTHIGEPPRPPPIAPARGPPRLGRCTPSRRRTTTSSNSPSPTSSSISASRRSRRFSQDTALPVSSRGGTLHR
ncbi:hypothetical protein [Thiocystis violascens]|uniref:hypothetical protein n=1 Tax=Thiocystis violascens TaxID=73141 RepID=UPI0002D58333|nr:hypothetical protein [Thiocystis violascens]